ncbi:MAG: DUF1801 domain-containing protein [Deinococcales bacterium]|nr:DUF1801 domain-containing protein [Deinococcales bacterium]
MRPAKHPHLESPTDAQLLEVLADRSEAMRDLYLQLHHLVLGTLPDVNASVDLVDGMTGYGVRQYGYGGWGMAALSAHAKWVRLVFMRATELDDPTGVLEGSGKSLRHVKVRSAEELAERAAAIRSLLVQASRLG